MVDGFDIKYQYLSWSSIKTKLNIRVDFPFMKVFFIFFKPNKILIKFFVLISFFLEEELSRMQENQHMDFSTMIRRDKKRWKVADMDNDGDLTYEEFVGFLHPEEKGHMREIVVEETMEDIDANGDGFVDIDEYIGKIEALFTRGV